MFLAALALLAGAAAGWAAAWMAPGRSRGTGPGGPADASPARAGRGSIIGPGTGVLVVAGAVLILLARPVPGSPGVGLLAGGYALLIGAAASRFRHPGLILVAAGLLANLIVIVADGGMPVAGQPAGVGLSGHHHGLSSRDHLTGLSDEVRLAPLGETLSPGDVLATLGGAVAVFSWVLPLAPTRPRRLSRRLPHP